MYQQHELSRAFPAMLPEELQALRQDIKANGLLSPIVKYQGEILDGWHRLGVCLTEGVEPRYIDLEEGLDPVRYVMSVNLHRRHLTGSQRASAAVACERWANDGHQPNRTPGVRLETNESMARTASVHPNTIKAAKKAHVAGLGDAVREGKVSAKDAAIIADLPENERQAAIERPTSRPKRQAHKDCGEVQELRQRVHEQEEDINAQALEILVLGEKIRVQNRIVKADDRTTASLEEIGRLTESCRVAHNRIDELMAHNHDLAGKAKMWKRKCQKFEAQRNEQAGNVPDEPDDEVDYCDESDSFEFEVAP